MYPAATNVAQLVCRSTHSASCAAAGAQRQAAHAQPASHADKRPRPIGAEPPERPDEDLLALRSVKLDLLLHVLCGDQPPTRNHNGPYILTSAKRKNLGLQ